VNDLYWVVITLLTRTDLLNLLGDNNYPTLRKTCEYNRDQLFDWANGGYKGERPPIQYYDKEGKITNKPSAKADDWNEKKRKTEDGPEEVPAILPSEPYMSQIIGLWEEGTPLLQDILINPEHIRTQSGEELIRINREINNAKNQYIRSATDEGRREEAKRTPALAIPTGDVIMMVVSCTERAISVGELNLDNDPRVKSNLDYIKEYVRRAGQGEMWIENMAEAYHYHIKKAKDLWAQGANSLEEVHAHEEFWNADLQSWISDQYMSSAPRQEAGPEWRPTQDTSQPNPDRMSVSEEDAGVGSATQEPGMPGPSGAEHPTTNTAAAEQSTAQTAQSQPSAESENVSGSSVPTTDDYTVNYGGVSRTIGGYKYCGIKSGGGPGFSVLVSMKGDKFYHMIASSDVDADDSGPLDYLEKGGYLVGDVRNVEKRLGKGTSIEGKQCHVEKQKFKDFKMSAFAVGARSSESTAKLSPHQYIKGHFDTGDYAGKEFWYTKSNFVNFRPFRERAVQNMIETFKKQHDINSKDEIKLEDRSSDNSNRWARRNARSSGGPTTRRRRGRSPNRGEPEDEGESIEDGSDGPLDQKDGVYSTTDPFGFVVPVPPADSSTSNTAGNTRSHEMGKMRAEIMASVDEKLASVNEKLHHVDTKLDAKMDQVMAMIQALTVNLTPK
jgi:hypothetical protein